MTGPTRFGGGLVVFALLLLTLSSTMAAAAGAPVAPAVPAPHWHLVNSSLATPLPRQSGAMVYDPAVHGYVLFGGYSGGGALGDTWVFSGGQWTDLTSTLTTAPSARWYDSMTWDPAAGYVVLFGGRDTATDFNDTWAFNGTAWQNLNLTVAPPPMTSGRTAYYPPDLGVILYGGYSFLPGRPTAYNATWLFAHGSWTNLATRVTGAPPDPHVITYAAYDPASTRILYLGGPRSGNGSCSVPSYTWTYRHGRFTNLSSSLKVEPDLAAGSRMMAYDPALSGVVVYGGWDGPGCPTYSNATWVFSHGAWALHPSGKNPGPLWDGAMAADPSRNSILLFGGNTVPNTGSQMSQTWRFGT